MLLLITNILLAVCDLFRSRQSLETEVMRLRHENSVLRRQAPARPKLTSFDRWFLVWLHKVSPAQAKLTLLVRPETLLRWHRQGFRCYWRWKSLAKPGRPRIERATIALIKRMARENVLWGAPRIHGELLKLGFEVAESTVENTCRASDREAAARPGGHSSRVKLTESRPSISSQFQPSIIKSCMRSWSSD